MTGVLSLIVEELEVLFDRLPDVFEEAVDRDMFWDIALEGREPSLEKEVELGELLEEFSELERQIRMKGRLAILMLAIDMEDAINMTSVYNLHKNVADTIEKLSPPDKLLVISSVLSHGDIKGNAVDEAAKKLTAWRNNFAHGHPVDSPAGPLRQRHLLAGDPVSDLPGDIQELQGMIACYLRVSEYLGSISRNWYTKSPFSRAIGIERLGQKCRRFTFDFLADGSYDLVVLDNEEET